MKKKLLIISTIAIFVILIVATIFFFLSKNAKTNNANENTEDYNVGHIVEKIEFLNFITYDEIKQYAENYPIYIQTSSDKNMFAIGELYIEDNPVTLFYQLNDDNTINRFDGKYSIELEKSDKDHVWNLVSLFNRIVVEHFIVGTFEYDMFDQDGAPIDAYAEESYELMLNGKARYNLSIIDRNETYWNISAVVVDKKYVEFDFFRCFDLSTYNDNSPNIDLRVSEEIGE